MGLQNCPVSPAFKSVRTYARYLNNFLRILHNLSVQRQFFIMAANGAAPASANKFFEDFGVWKDAPVLTGSTKYEPLPDVKNIMITGGAGFIACWLVRHLTLTYPNAYNIVSFDKLDYCASLNNTRCLQDKKNFTFYHGDITNPSEVMDCLERHKIDTVFHFAAQSHVDLSFGNSYAFTHTNVYGTHVLLESAKKVGIKKFIHISTDEVYGEVRDDADDLLETSILAPTNPYAASKAAAEMLVHSYQKSFKLPVIIVRSNKHTVDRPFNDHRYAVDGTKLRQLGWEQKTSFSDGMAITVDWYKRFGEKWWGDITKVLTPFPTVTGTEVVASNELVEDIHDNMIVDSDDKMTLAKKRKTEA